VYTFDAVVRSTVHEIKYKGKSRLAFTLMQAAAASIPAGVVEHIDALIPVPLHKSRMRKRGYNQAQMLAEGLCAGLGGHPPVWDTLVRRTRKTKTQTRMNHEQRQKNMRTVFTLTDTAVLSDKHLLIVDDVVTTGATAGALAEVLLRGGAASINVLCLARD
jgi:ComF family protein